MEWEALWFGINLYSEDTCVKVLLNEHPWIRIHNLWSAAPLNKYLVYSRQGLWRQVLLQGQCQTCIIGAQLCSFWKSIVLPTERNYLIWYPPLSSEKKKIAVGVVEVTLLQESQSASGSCQCLEWRWGGDGAFRIYAHGSDTVPPIREEVLQAKVYRQV